jgi:hypothetical protein
MLQYYIKDFFFYLITLHSIKSQYKNQNFELSLHKI